jgi:hypothetical protein
MSLDNNFEVTVFIATTAEKKREDSIRHAIQSVLTQAHTKLVVIINGDRFDCLLKLELESLTEIECHYLSLGNFPEALRYARKMVNTNYFSFLDDDDELTTDSISNRLNIIKQSSCLDVVIGNGYRNNKNNVKSLVLDTDKIDRFNQDPIYSLFQKRGNWLASCSGLYRTSSIPQKYFDDYAKYAEWSYLAVKIACYKNIKLIEAPCFIINETSESLSQGFDYYEAQYNYLFKLLDMKLPEKINNIIETKKVDMQHQLSVLCYENGEISKAWSYHWLSLRSLYGFKRYILSTRHLFVRV